MSWSERYVDDGARPFRVEDGTGTAYVDPDGSALLLTSGEEITVGAGEEPPARVREFLDRETNLEAVDSRRRRYKAVRIEPGDPVLVAGATDPDGADAPADPATTAIGDGPDAPRFYATDDPDHGLGSRLVREILGYALAAAVLFASASYLYLG